MGNIVKNIKFALHISIHPFDGFWDMKYEKRGSIKFAALLVFSLFIAFSIERQITGFYFNQSYGKTFDIMLEIRRAILPFIIFCVANWSVTTLMGGEGKFSDIVMATSYAMVPIIIIKIPAAIVSNFLISSEISYINFLGALSIVWFSFLLFAGILTVHQYTPAKTILTLIITGVSMAVILFVGMLFFSLATEIVGFLYSIYIELTLRI